MKALSLEPFAVQQRWELPVPRSGAAWQQLLSDYVAQLAHACAAAETADGGAPVIGHIKLLALFPEHDYLRVSSVSAGHPPTCTGRAPDGLAGVSVTLNVLVYGIARDVLQKLAGDIASTLAAAHAGRVTVETGADVGRPSFPDRGEGGGGPPSHPHHHAG